MKKKWLVVAVALVLATFAMAFTACNLFSGKGGSDNGGDGGNGGSSGDGVPMSDSYAGARAQLRNATNVVLPALADADADFQIMDGNGAQGYIVTIRGAVSQETFETFVRYFDQEFADGERSDGGGESPYPTMMYRGDNVTVGVAWNEDEQTLMVSVVLGQGGGNYKAHEHEGEWIEDRKATCFTPGERHRVCTICGENQIEYFGGDGHQGDWTVTREPTCTDDGEQSRVCTVCGESETKKIDRTGHKLGNDKHTLKSVTCGVGITYTLCETCGAYVYGVNPADTSRQHHFNESGVCTTCGEHRATDGITYDTTGDTAIVTGYEGSESEIYIPSYYDGKRVTEIGENAFQNSNLAVVTIAEGVTKIGDGAFSSSTSLTALSIPATLTELSYSSFSYCYELRDVRYEGAIEGWLGLANLYSIMNVAGGGDYCLTIDGEKIQDTLWIPAGIKNVPSYAFYRRNEVTGLGTEEGLLTIGESAFKYCFNMYDAIFADTIKSIGEEAFYECFFDCASVTLRLPAALTRIESGAFSNCRNLGTVRLPDGVKVIESDAFSECIALTRINLPEGLTEIGINAFGDCYALTSLAIPSTLVKIGERALLSCGSKLTSLTVAEGNPVYRGDGNCLIERATGTVILGCNVSVIPRGVVAIGEGAFVNCSSMTAISLPDTLTTIEARAFLYAIKLSSITIPNGVKEIKSSAFSSCRGLTTVNLSVGLEKIGERAFDCYYLTDINYGGSKAQWAQIEKEEGWLRTNGVCAIHCTDGDVE